MTQLEENLSRIVAQIESGDPAGTDALYRTVQRGVRLLLWRHVSQDEVEDRLQNVIVKAVEKIQAGDLREPLAVIGYVRTIARREVAQFIEHEITDRKVFDRVAPIQDRGSDRGNPETNLLLKERVQIVREALAKMRPIDREVLTRFYIEDQKTSEICEAMRLTEHKFKNLKHRAKAKITEAVQKRTAKPTLIQRLLS